MSETVVELMSRVRSALKDSAHGPLRVAHDVMAAASAWDPKEHEGKSFSSTLMEALGPSFKLSFWEARRNALDALGGMKAAVIFRHDAAVWITGQLQNGKLQEAVRVCADAYVRNHKVALSQKSVERATREVRGYRPPVRISESAALEAELQRLRIRVAELEAENEELRSNKRFEARAKAGQ